MRKSSGVALFVDIEFRYGCMRLRHTHPPSATWTLYEQCYSTAAPVSVAAAEKGLSRCNSRHDPATGEEGLAVQEPRTGSPYLHQRQLRSGS